MILNTPMITCDDFNGVPLIIHVMTHVTINRVPPRVYLIDVRMYVLMDRKRSS